MSLRNLVVSALLVSALALPAMAQTAPKYQKLSDDLISAANSALGADMPEEARLLFERALVADPANVTALVGLGRSYEKEGRVGRGLKYYRKALEIEPNDMQALEVQALAFLKRDLPDRAADNRDRLARLCLQGCDALASVDVALEAYKAAKSATTAEASPGR